MTVLGIYLCKEVQEFASDHPEISLYLIQHPVNAGKGAAICTAIAHAKSDFCLIQDADFEYDPAEYPKLLAPPYLRGRRCRSGLQIYE